MPEDETEPTSLADLVERALRRHDIRASTELHRIAAAAGLEITHTTLNKIRTGKYRSTPTPKTIAALSYLSGVPLDQVKRLVGTAGDTRPFAERLPPAIDALPMDRQEAILLVMRKMVADRLELIRLTDGLTETVEAAGQPPEDLSGTSWLDTAEDDEGETGHEDDTNG